MLKVDQIERPNEVSEHRPDDTFQPSQSPGHRIFETRAKWSDVSPVAPVTTARHFNLVTAVAGQWSRSNRTQRTRWISFALLPIALIWGAYWYVTGNI